MKNLVIIGARGYAREVYGMCVNGIPAFLNGEMSVKGFLDDKTDALDGFPGDYPPILGPVETYEIETDDVFVCALGDPVYRRKYAEMILRKGGEFISLIHPDAGVSPLAKIGKGSIISRWCSISNNVEIGDFTMVHSFTTMGHDVKIGAYNSIESYCFFGGFSSTGDNTAMHVRSTIIANRHVGANVSVGCGSVVMRNYGDNVHLFGIPAKRMEF